jgi:hypothetical protein
MTQTDTPFALTPTTHHAPCTPSTMMVETVVDLIDKPGSSFVWAPRVDYLDLSLRPFIEQHVVQQGLPVVVTNVSKGNLPPLHPLFLE